MDYIPALPVMLAIHLDDEETLVYGINDLINRYFFHYLNLARKHKPKRILETGVRYGYTGLMLLMGSEALSYTGIDIDSKALEIARKHFKTYAWRTKVELICSDVRDIEPEELGTFDLMHLDAFHDNVEVELEIAETVLSPGGILIVDDCRADSVGKPVRTWMAEHCEHPFAYVDSLTGQLVGKTRQAEETEEA